MSAAIYGLILAGGSSSRMKRDKVQLAYQGKNQLDRAVELASRHVQPVFVSVRAGQAADPARAHHRLIVDSVVGEGPIIGIRSALAAHPEAAWLVIACDLPFLTDAVLAHLLAERDPAAPATAYRSARDGLPEPLCALWEPRAATELADYQSEGGRCPRKFLMSRAARIIELVDRRALDNVNTPEEYAQAIGLLASGTDRKNAMNLDVRYYALMREQAGRSEEKLDTSAATPEELYAELSARHGFTLSREQLKVAVNGEFCEWSHPLSAGDAVVFIPPVAGG